MEIRIALSLAVIATALGGCDSARASGQARMSVPACEVGRIVDGDTFYCADGRKVRLIGIDSPELRQGESGRIARGALGRFLQGGRVRLETDVSRRDRWGRTLAYAWSGGRLVNEAMVREGWAVLYTVPPDVKYAGRLERAQSEARARRAGLWESGGFDCLPSQYRRRRCVSGP
ncbi:MAG: thermonuclease family protein [Gemmatimonadales bacterium]|nr:thermonuclease family protein [Gemmatimonadales bacterium]MBA3554177.1 thermonuclease family protein [Gemmatimonadales bacterium]